MKSIALNNQDVTDTPVIFQPGQDVDSVQIRLTNRTTEVRGRVFGDGDTAVAESTVVLFSSDPGRWNEGSRFIASSRSRRDGQYSLSGLPAGDYLAVALESIEAGQEQDPDFLMNLRARATKVTAIEGDVTALDLRLIKAGG